MATAAAATKATPKHLKDWASRVAAVVERLAEFEASGGLERFHQERVSLGAQLLGVQTELERAAK